MVELVNNALCLGVRVVLVVAALNAVVEYVTVLNDDGARGMAGKKPVSAVMYPAVSYCDPLSLYDVDIRSVFLIGLGRAMIILEGIGRSGISDIQVLYDDVSWKLAADI